MPLKQHGPVTAVAGLVCLSNIDMLWYYSTEPGEKRRWMTQVAVTDIKIWLT